MEYKELLQTNEWKIKCSNILQRDHYVCQDCGCVGIHNKMFFPISCINDLNKFLPNSLFNGESLSTFSDNIPWRKKSISPFFLDCFFLREQLYIYTMCIHDYYEEFIFAADTQLSEIHFVEYRNDEIRLQYNSKDIKGRLFAFKFEENLGTTNYASVNYHVKNEPGSNLEELEISIFFLNKCLIFNFTYSSFGNDAMLFNFTPLNVHHNYYVLGKKPWEYNDNALVTLCSQCHQKRHLQNSTPIYTLDKCISIPSLPLCDRCHGTGYLPQYHYYMGGICFKCQGEGVEI